METSEELRAVEEVAFRGHPLVSGSHGRTIEITTEEHLTPAGDCILGVGASKGLAQLSPWVKSALKVGAARVRFSIKAPGGEFSFFARGSEQLSFESTTDMVIRRSSYVCGRTLAIQSESSAREVPRALVQSLRSPEAVGLLRIEVYH